MIHKLILDRITNKWRDYNRRKLEQVSHYTLTLQELFKYLPKEGKILFVGAYADHLPLLKEIYPHSKNLSIIPVDSRVTHMETLQKDIRKLSEEELSAFDVIVVFTANCLSDPKYHNTKEDGKEFLERLSKHAIVYATTHENWEDWEKIKNFGKQTLYRKGILKSALGVIGTIATSETFLFGETMITALAGI